ncbi:MAG: phenylalanine--tRNA ligase subunit beta [Dermabacter sp.]|nr:phenylalanine--tRNA ligase subunit beta [Dermabacter sp.]
MPRIPLTWLGEHVELADGTTAEAVAASLVGVGLEEEAIHGASVSGPLVVGRVLNLVKEEQKNGKTINWCRVDVGPEHNEAADNPKDPQPGPEQPSRGIICGAHNFVQGDLVVVSLPGTVLPGPFPIQGRKTYGHFSDGMICSTEELGLGEDPNHGIIVLGQGDFQGVTAEPGADAIALLGLGEEVVEINVTPDRGYCFSMRGVAREYSHATGQPFTDPAALVRVPAPAGAGHPVRLEDEAPIRGQLGCTAYVAQTVTGIDPTAASPRWMQQHLRSAGMRPISLVVDVANYVMLDLGQPLHTFDADLVDSDIVVRRAREGEVLRTLDDAERTLASEDLVITDRGGERVIAIAGVMGGASTEVSETTTNVLIEGASFSPMSIARSARRHRLPSEASKRLERGVDPALPEIAVRRAAELLAEYGGGSIADERTVARAGEAWSAPEITMDLGFPARIVGVDYTREQIEDSLKMIGCTVVADGDTLRVSPPSWRPDLTIREALVEEVARLVGYGDIPSLLPSAPGGRGLTRAQRARRAVGTALAEAGLTEVLSLPFTNEKTLDDLRLDAASPLRGAVRILNPLSDDAPLMRTAILETLLPVARLNLARGEDSVAIFETGLAFAQAGDRVPVPSAASRPSDAELAQIDEALARQSRAVALVLAGPLAPAGVLGASRSWDWADAVTLAERIAAAAGATIRVSQGEFAPMHPGRTARLTRADGELLGYAGELHPSVCAAFSLPTGACALELQLDRLIDAAPEVVPAVPVSTYPLAKEDFAFVVDEDTPAAAVEAALIVGIGDVAETVRLFDEYRGDQVDAGKKSLAFAVRLRPSAGTLTGEDIACVREQAVAAVETAVGGRLRA